MLSDKRGWQQYKYDCQKVGEKENRLLASVNLAEIPLKARERDKLLYLDLFFNEIPDKENGRLWGLNLGTQHPNIDYLPICVIVNKDDDYYVHSLHQIPLSNVDVVLSDYGTQYINLYAEKA